MVFGVLGRRVWHCLTVSTRHSFDTLRIEQCVLFHSEITRTSSRIHEKSHDGLWNVLFFGTDEFALQSFKMLNERYRMQQLIKRLEVVTAYKGNENAIILYANRNNIPVHSWPLTIPLSEFHLGLVVSFGHMIPAEMIASFPLGMINVHASLLPKLRGAAPIVHALMNGDRETGITIMKILPNKFDVGEILAQERTSIHPDETMPELYIKLANLGANLLMRTMEKLPGILSEGQKQCDTQATYARKITAKTSQIRWNEMSARNIYDLQRALTGLHTPTAKFEEKTIKLLGIRIFEESPSFNSTEKRPGFVVYDKQKTVLLTRCKDDSWISIKEIVVPGRRPMSAKDFKNGFIKNKASIFFQ